MDKMDEWYLEISQDFNKFLVQQLIEDRKYDSSVDYELNEMFSQLGIEQQAEMLDPSNSNIDSAVCALCKCNVVRRVHGTRLVCEKPGCLNINMLFPDFTVEELMISLCKLVNEHKSHAM